MNQETTNTLVDRLAELAAGAEPAARTQGICNDISASLYERHSWGEAAEGLGRLYRAFRELGGDSAWPLGRWNHGEDLWAGQYGADRRRLCYDVLVWMLQRHEYTGRYA